MSLNEPRTGIEPRPGVLNISPYKPGAAPDLDFERIVNISNNESPYGPSPHALAAAARSVEAGFHLYPDPSCTALRQAIAAAHGIAPDNIVCSNGSEELLGLVAKAFARDGDEIVFSQYGFMVFAMATHAVGATPVVAAENNYTASVDAILDAVTAKTKIVYLANPNNPTGTYLPRDELERLRAGLPAGVLLVLDCAYAEFAVADDYDVGMDLVADGTDNTLVARTFSKIYGLAAARVGWAYCPEPVADVLHRVRGVFNVSGLSQAAAAAAVADQDFVADVRAKNRTEREKVSSALTDLGLNVLPSQGNFVLVRFADAAAATGATQHLAGHGVFVRPVANYGLTDALRISIGTAEENEIFLSHLGQGL